MTCFCDLPLSQLHEHLDFYGGYGIGMKKEWGIHQKINPVLYMHQNSDLSEYISTLLMDLKVGNAADKRTLLHLMNILRHVKLYEGDAVTGGRRIHKRFYDEREWRWVPLLTGNNDEILSLTEAEFNDPEVRGKAEYELAQIAKLDFVPGDIKYIVVSSEGEVSEIIDRTGAIEGKYSENDTRILCTRILSSEQIKTDF